MNYQSDQYSPNTSFTFFPPAVKNLLWINALFFLGSVNVFTGEETLLWRYFQYYLALYPLGSGNFEIWQLISYMFLHGGIGHIFFNLFALWMFGQAIENFWGTKRFVIYYFLTGIGAGLLHILINSDPVATSQGLRYVPTIGASGAVYGILLAFGMMFPERPIYLFLLPIPVKAKYFVAFFGVIELISGITRPGSGVAHFAHLGGMVVGFILIKYWGLKGEKY